MPGRQGSRTRRPVGPTTIMSPTRRAPGTLTPRSSRSCTPRGPTRSPQALSRGNVALSTSATRAPPRARTSAAMLPAGPGADDEDVEALVRPPPLPACARPYGVRRARAPRGTMQPIRIAVRPGPVRRAAGPLRPAGRSAFVRPEPPVAPGDVSTTSCPTTAGLDARCRHRAPPASPSSSPVAARPASSAST